MAAAGQRSPGGSQFSLGQDDCPKSAIVKSLAEKTQYWSHKALHEDKKRCLADMPHCAHVVSNTLEDFHEDAKAKSNKAIAERVKLHGKVLNDNSKKLNWGRRPSEPTYDYGNQQFYSHEMMAEAKRRVLPMPSARCAPGETLDKTSQAGSNNGSKSARELRRPGSAAGSYTGSGTTALGSPDIWRILSHGNKTAKDAHNQTAAKLEKLRKTQASRDTTTYSRSFGDLGGHKALEDMTNSEIQYQRYGDARGYAGADGNISVPDGWGNVESYNSQVMFHLDKMRHATQIDKGEKKNPQHVIVDAYPSWGGGQDADDSESKPLYRSAETMRQHKKKHRADLRATPGSRMLPGTTGLSPGVLSPPGMSDSFSAPSGIFQQTSGMTSQRDFQNSKKFHSVKLEANQDLQATEIAGKPWPKPGDKLIVYSRAGSVSDTPAYPPAVPGTSYGADKMWKTTYATDIHAKSLQKYSVKSGVRNAEASEASDTKLLHMSQAEFADRKALCQTHVRTVPGATSVKDERQYGNGLRHLGPRKDPGSGKISSQKQMEYSKAVGKHTLDDPKRARPEPVWNPPPETPAPRSGQWTPAHA